MSLVVARECVALGLRAGAVVFRGVSVGPAGAALRAEVAREVEAVRGRFADPRAVWALPEVVHFQEMLRQVGVRAERERPSVGRLLSLALQRGDLPAVNNLVEAYNLVSVRTLCSLGAHDLDRVAVPVELRLFTGQESFTPLGGDREVPVTPGEFGYVDAAGRVLCRLDVRQADFSKVTPATRNALLIVEATAAHPPETLRRAFDEAVDLIRRHCGGTAEVVSFPPS